jgi:hypothetical protein
MSFGFVTEPPQDNEMDRTDKYHGAGLYKSSPELLQE